MIAFNTRLKALREEKKLSQKEIANLVKTQQQVVSKWENGASEPDFASLEILCEFFDVSADYILGLDETFVSKKMRGEKELSMLQIELLTAFDKLSMHDQYKALGVILGFIAY